MKYAHGQDGRIKEQFIQYQELNKPTCTDSIYKQKMFLFLIDFFLIAS